MDELSEGELVEDETSPNRKKSPAANGQDATSVAVGAKPQSLEGGKPTTDEPQAKKPRLEASTGDHPVSEEGWQGPTKKQLKKMTKRKQRERKLHQELENKYVATATPFSSEHHLSARQRDIIDALALIACGKQPPNRGQIQKLKTIQFQRIISHFVTGYPAISVGEPVESIEDRWGDHKIVVVWLSMISSEFARKPNHFSKLKHLHPCVTFDIEHPGSSRFVKFGLESFMMLANDDASSSQLNTPASQDVEEKIPTRCAYLFSQSDLSDHDFPNPSQGSVDQRGRDIASYVSIVDWPSCEIKDTPEVTSAQAEDGEGKEMPIFAIDCEMVQTEEGSELGRISIVNESLECVYDTYVKPESDVINYRTKFSGLTAAILEDIKTNLKDVQGVLPSLLPTDSILIGHSLENDFHAMKFRHPFVIDTSCIFTPLATPTAKPGLRKLCKELLVADIQNSDKGHDSVEDATACMKLIKLKLRKGDKCKIAFNEISPSIFTEFRIKGCTTGMVDKDSLVRLFGKGASVSAEVTADEEAVTKSIEIIPQSKFTFVQLHSMEYLLKSENGENSEKIVEVADNLDSQVIISL